MATCTDAAVDLRSVVRNVSQISIADPIEIKTEKDQKNWGQETPDVDSATDDGVTIKQEKLESRKGNPDTGAHVTNIEPIRWIVENGMVKVESMPVIAKVKQEPPDYPSSSSESYCAVGSGSSQFVQTHNGAGTHELVSRQIASALVTNIGDDCRTLNSSLVPPSAGNKPTSASVTPSERGEGQRAKKVYICVTCGMHFDDLGELSNHQKLHRFDKPFSRMKALERKNHASLQKKVSYGEKPYPCSSCGKCFAKSSQLSRHNKIHTREQRFKCASCPKTFVSACKLNSHQKVHIGEQTYRCPTCGKIFARPNYLTSHQKIHSGEKPYRCTTCGKAFTYAHHVTRHQRSHTGEKPYNCVTCGKAFAWPHNVTKHQRVHTGERPYSCSACGNTFAQLHHLVLHQRIHTGEKPYKCGTCDKAFTQLNQLVRHKRVHTGEKPYSCTQCGKAFASASNLNAHQRIHKSQI